MRDILKQTNLFVGPIGCFATAISTAILEAETAEDGGTLAYVTDDSTGVSILQNWGSLERIRGKNNPKLSIQVVHPALDVEKQIERIKSIADKRPLIVVRDYSRDLAPLHNGAPWIFWQGIIQRTLGCKVLSLAHWGHLPIPEPLDWKQFQSVFKVVDGHKNGPGGPRERVNEPYDLIQAKGGDRVVRLLGRPHVGLTVFDQIKELVS